MTIAIEKNHSTPVHRTGYDVLAQRGTLVVGISPGNSYFDEATIQELLQFTSTLSRDVRIMVPDVPAVHTYRALEEKKPEREARLAGNSIQNKCARSIEKILSENGAARVRLLEWSDDIALHPAYVQSKKEIRELYARCDRFRTDARETTRAVLASKYRGTDLEGAIDEAVNYLLDELSFLSVSPSVLGVDRVAYVYHQNWPVFENLINGVYDKARPTVGTLITTKD